LKKKAFNADKVMGAHAEVLNCQSRFLAQKFGNKNFAFLKTQQRVR